MKTPKEQIIELMMGKTIEEIERNNAIVQQQLLKPVMKKLNASEKELVADHVVQLLDEAVDIEDIRNSDDEMGTNYDSISEFNEKEQYWQWEETK